ncbi:MAG: flagellar brake protein [Thiobacillus sp.]|uniref:flagellar brake protein n=1 Tax=Thiobacillus sp. TaxID=924 RepID=UPI00168C9B8F|nr:flagellar brake protein [Thiobacillus sp.]QLQ03406.1 MAG: flagellar brake protein [Thiobacillus sp.]
MSEQHKSTAPDKPTSGGPEDSSAKAGKVEPASPQRESGVLSLDQIKLGIGDTIQLQFQSDVEPSRCFVTLIGYLEGQSVIVTTPIINGSLMLVREGQDFVVRLFSGKTAYAFTAMAKRVTNTPYPHLHLAYPKEVRGLVVRGSSRGRINIICHATSEGGRGHACVARDISLGGALLAAGEKMGDVGSPLTLKFRVKIGDAEHVLVLDCTIRSVNASRPTVDENLTLLHGLSFDNVNSQDTLVISALLYQNMISAQEVER